MQYPKLYQHFNEFIALKEQVYLDVEKRLIRKTIKEKEYLIKEGEVIRYLPYIKKGLFAELSFRSKG